MPLEIKDLCKSFGEKVIFSGFSYTFADKGIYALVGDSGVGKTTLLRMIAGLDKAFAGEISGADTVSYSFQEYRLFDALNALENVYELAYAKKTADAVHAAREMLLSLGFDEKELTLMPRALSGGMKQRVALARAFLYPADVYLFDEPFKELDPVLIETVKKRILWLSEKHTVIVSVHSKEESDALGADVIEIR